MVERKEQHFEIVYSFQTVDFIGSIDANSSIIVPVKATLKNRVKRNVAAMTVCGLSVLYDYICGGTKTRSLGVTLTREYPGTPLLPCGGVIGGRRRWGGIRIDFFVNK